MVSASQHDHFKLTTEGGAAEGLADQKRSFVRVQSLLLSVFLLLPNIPVGDDHLSVCPLLLLLLHQNNSLWDKVLMTFFHLSVTDHSDC